MKKIILFNATTTEKRAALLEDGKLAELVVERPDKYRILGNIYRGRVTTILAGIQSAFIDIGLDMSAFLHASDVDPALLMNEDAIEHYTGRGEKSKRKQIARVPIEEVLSVGQDILVQVTKEPIGNKSPKVTTQISLAGRFLVLVPDTDFIGVSKKTQDQKARQKLKRLVSQIKPKGIGFIVRTIGLKVSETEFVAEMKSLISQWGSAQKTALSGSGPKLILKECSITTQVIRDLFSEDVSEVHVDQSDDYDEVVAYVRSFSAELCKRVHLYKGDVPLFDSFNIEKEIDRSLKRKVWLKNGGYLYFDHAEALWAIDVNTGRNIGKKDLEETIMQTNLAAVGEICRQLRLRDIGGLIVVDFIDMRKADHRRRIEEEMRRQLSHDPTTTSCTGLSKFGLIEITRKRVRPELQELFTDLCHACNGLGRVFSPATVTASIDRWLQRARTTECPRTITIMLSPSVHSYIKKDNARIIKEMEKLYGFTIELVIDESLDQDEFSIFDQKNRTELTEKYS
ncbi:MAG: Rne/Rng family ribonuclease [Chitinivibrionales bacterium]|nr:Rne/Rng family ribonuclease [Chitinivibrionales bacterium]